jgi:hypothetical protein
MKIVPKKREIKMNKLTRIKLKMNKKIMRKKKAKKNK